MKFPPARRAFTLIELLCIVGVLCLLAALLFPALKGMRERADRVTCASNLRQLHQAILAYTQDHNTELIEVWSDPAKYGTSNSYSWHVRLVRGGYLGAPSAFSASKQSEWSSSWFKTMSCPAARRNLSPNSATPYPRTYGINEGVAQQSGVRLSKIPHPQQCMLLGDGYPEGPDSFKPGLRPTAWGPSTPHKDHANLIFVDGHVESRRGDEITLYSSSAPDSVRNFWYGGVE